MSNAQSVVLDRLQEIYGHETAHLDTEEQILIALAVARTFNEITAYLIAERDAEKQVPASETKASRCNHPANARSLTNRCLICDAQVVDEPDTFGTDPNDYAT